MIGIPIGLAYTGVAEWLIHKYVLHGWGKNKGSYWNFHWREHHRAAKQNGMHDPDYERSLLGWHAQSKEALGLAGAAVVHLPLLPVAPFFTGTVLWAAVDYYRKHKRAHLDPDWAVEHLPWHVDHHMGRNPDLNWGVTRPWVDDLLGTREEGSPWLLERQRR